jgi:hypothetical protein
MIGRFDLDAPAVDAGVSEMVESNRAKTGQDYNAILLFGLWGTADCSAEVRLRSEEHTSELQSPK